MLSTDSMIFCKHLHEGKISDNRNLFNKIEINNPKGKLGKLRLFVFNTSVTSHHTYGELCAMFHRQLWLSFPGLLLCCFHSASCPFHLIVCVTPCSNRDRQTHPDLSASLAPGTAGPLQLRDQRETVWRQLGCHNAPTQPL